VQETVAKEVQADLKGRGHHLTTASGAIAAPVMIVVDQKTGTIYAAGDPAAGRHAAAAP
jgi:D-alanyl-D-alanine carboxypeptidase